MSLADASQLRLRPARIVMLFAALLLLRLTAAVLVNSLFDVEKDVDSYGLAADSILQGLGFTIGGDPSLWKPPLYSYFLAAIFSLLGRGMDAVLYVHATLDALTALLVFWMGRSLFAGNVGCLGAGMFCLYPLSAYYTLRLLPEPLFTFLLTAAAATYLHARRSRRGPWFIAAGALGALAALSKPVAQLFIPFLIIAERLMFRRRPRATLRALGAMLVAFALTLAPWTLRNYSLTGHFVPVATGDGYQLWLGTHSPTRGLEYEEISDDETMRALLDGRKKVLARVYGSIEAIPNVEERDGWMVWSPRSISYEENEAFRDAALEQIADDPGAAALLSLKKLFRFWFSVHQVKNQWAQPYIYLVQGILLALALYGTVLALRRRIDVLALLAPIVYLAGVYTATYATIRYCMPTMPFVMLLAALALMHLMGRLNALFGLSLPAWEDSAPDVARRQP